MTIAQAEHPHPRRLEGTALLVRSTHSYRFATIRFATSRNGRLAEHALRQLRRAADSELQEGKLKKGHSPVLQD